MWTRDGSQPNTETNPTLHSTPWWQLQQQCSYAMSKDHTGDTWLLGPALQPLSRSLHSAGSPGRCCPQSGQFGSGSAREVPRLCQGSRSQPPQGPGTGAAPHLVPTCAGSSPLGTCHQDQSSVSTSTESYLWERPKVRASHSCLMPLCWGQETQSSVQCMERHRLLSPASVCSCGKWFNSTERSGLQTLQVKTGYPSHGHQRMCLQKPTIPRLPLSAQKAPYPADKESEAQGKEVAQCLRTLTGALGVIQL